MVHVFIINPETGRDDFGENLRRLLGLTNITYYVFDTRYEGEEKELVKRVINLFEEEDIRIYSCGGSGTIRNIIDGLEHPEKVELAFYPNGMTNDFLRCFGDDAEKFTSLDDLIEGEVVDIDYISTNVGKGLNTVSLGVDADAIRAINVLRSWSIFSNKIPYILGMLHSLIHLKNKDYVIEIDGIELKSSFSEIIFYNGCMLAGRLWLTNNPKLADGEAEYGVIMQKSKIKLLRTLRQAVRSDLKSAYSNLFHGTCKKMVIRRNDNMPFIASFDGELVQVPDTLEITINNKGLRFVLPKGVSLP